MRLSQSITERTSSIGTSLTASSEATGGGRTNLVSGIIAISSGRDYGTELRFGYENSFRYDMCNANSVVRTPKFVSNIAFGTQIISRKGPFLLRKLFSYVTKLFLSPKLNLISKSWTR